MGVFLRIGTSLRTIILCQIFTCGTRFSSKWKNVTNSHVNLLCILKITFCVEDFKNIFTCNNWPCITGGVLEIYFSYHCWRFCYFTVIKYSEFWFYVCGIMFRIVELHCRISKAYRICLFRNAFYMPQYEGNVKYESLLLEEFWWCRWSTWPHACTCRTKQC